MMARMALVMAASNVIISLLRNLIPNRIRIIVQLVVVAAMVVLVDQILKAFAYDVYKELSIFIGLVNFAKLKYFSAAAVVTATTGCNLSHAEYRWLLK